VMCERRAPGVQYERGTDLGAKVFAICGDRADFGEGERSFR